MTSKGNFWIGARELSKAQRTEKILPLEEFKEILAREKLAQKFPPERYFVIPAAGVTAIVQNNAGITPAQIEEIVENLAAAQEKVMRLHGFDVFPKKVEIVISTEVGTYISPRIPSQRYFGSILVGVHDEYANSEYTLVVNPVRNNILNKQLGSMLSRLSLHGSNFHDVNLEIDA